MAGSLLDGLCDVFDDSDHEPQQTKSYFGEAFPEEKERRKGTKEAKKLIEGKGKGHEEAKKGAMLSLTEAADYMMRAMQVALPDSNAAATISGTDSEPPSSAVSAVSPDEQIEYYRRMVQMQEELTDEDGMIPYAASMDNDGNGLRICAEFQASGDCKLGIKCGFVHEGAFRKGGGKGYVNVDPEDFFRRALQLRSSSRKVKKTEQGRETEDGQANEARVKVPVQDRWTSSLGNW
jgi:hypothetical protein